MPAKSDISGAKVLISIAILDKNPVCLIVSFYQFALSGNILDKLVGKNEETCKPVRTLE
jgi:hypothetical protein